MRTVLNVYMEEPPLISEWRTLTETSKRGRRSVLYFLCLHSYEDIPQLIGIARVGDRQPLRPRSAPARFSGAILTNIGGRSLSLCTIDRYRSRFCRCSSSSRQASQKVEIALALGFFLRKIAVPRMKETTCKKLQEIGGICAGRRMHAKTNEATGGDDSRGAQLPVAGGL